MCGGGFTKEFYQFRHSLPSIGNFGPVFLDCLPGFWLVLFFQCMPYGMIPSVRHRAIIEVSYCYYIIVINIVYTIQFKKKLNWNYYHQKISDREFFKVYKWQEMKCPFEHRKYEFLSWCNGTLVWQRHYRIAFCEQPKTKDSFGIYFIGQRLIIILIYRHAPQRANSSVLRCCIAISI